MSNTNIKSPLTKGIAKVPVIMQMEALECGAACLAMISAYYEKWIPLEQVRIDCGVSRDGSNAKNILVAARSYGLTAKGYRYDIDDLKKNGKFPCIVHWNFNHFVVVDGFRKDKVVINDPGQGRVQLSMEEFDRSFTGPCMMFAPGPDFEPSGKRRNTFDQNGHQDLSFSFFFDYSTFRRQCPPFFGVARAEGSCYTVYEKEAGA